MESNKVQISLKRYNEIKDRFRDFKKASKKRGIKDELMLDIESIRRNLRKDLVVRQVQNGYSSQYA